MGWPQITWIALVSASVGIAAVKHGEKREPYNFFTIGLSAAISAGLLYAGGFFS